MWDTPVGKGMQKPDKMTRLELYKEPTTQALLSKFLSGEISELEPIYDSTLGYRYTVVEEIVGNSEKAERLLNKLWETGIFERKLYDKIIFCPKCGQANISVHYSCPYCKSFDMQRSALIEHVKCGYMDVEDNFKKGGRLICPKCGEELRKIDTDFRKAGMWCTCKDCGKSFDIPVAVNFCRDCRANFTFEEVTIKDIYSYSLKEEVKDEAVVGGVLLAPLRELLEENEFEVESPAFLKGKSGANHMFDIVAFKGEVMRKPIVIDVAISSSDVVTEQPVIALFAKIFDVSPENAYLIAIPAINDNGKKMAELYKIQVIEARNQKEAIKSLKDKLLKKQP